MGFVVDVLLLVLMFIPGFLATLLAFRKYDFWELLALSFGFGVAINVALMFALSFIQLSKIAIVLFLFLVSLILLVFVVKENKWGVLKEIKFSKKDILILLVLIFIFLLVFKVHFAYTGEVYDPHSPEQYLVKDDALYKYPIHADEWSFLTRAKSIVDTGETNSVPFMAKQSFNLETGAHLFYAEILYVLSSVNPITSFQFFPAFMVMFNSLWIFVLARRLFNFNVGIFGALFFASIPSNINLLGNWFFVPLTFSLFLIFFSTFLMFEKKKYLSYFIMLITLFIYPPIFVVQVFLLILFNYKSKKLWLSLIILFLIILIYLFAVDKSLSSYLVFRDWTYYEVEFNVILFYGVMGFALALIGFLKKQWLLWVTGFFLANILLHYFIDITLFIPYQRVFFYYLVSLAVPSAVGLDFILKKLKEIKGYKILIYLIIILAVFSIQFYGYYQVDDKNLVLLHLIQDRHYDSLSNSSVQRIIEEKTVLADPLVSFALYPVAGAYPYSIDSANLAFRKEKVQFYSEFLTLECEAMLEEARNREIDFVFTDYLFMCENLPLRYNTGKIVIGQPPKEDNLFIYEVL